MMMVVMMMRRMMIIILTLGGQMGHVKMVIKVTVFIIDHIEEGLKMLDSLSHGGSVSDFKKFVPFVLQLDITMATRV